MNIQPFLVGAALCVASWSAQALQITKFSPQGEVARAHQVVVQFDSAAVRFGDAQAPAPLALLCSDAQASQGSGRWTSEREWVFDFTRDLPPGVRCTVQFKPGFKSASGAALTRASSYSFHSGGPFVQQPHPGTWGEIDEEQFFILQLNGAATLASVQQHVWCETENVGERIAVRLIEGAQRAELLKSQNLDKSAAQQPLAWQTLACNRRLTPSTKLQLVWGAGVATPSGITNRVEKRFTYDVRAPFSADFRCERENAQAACLPIRPMTLAFNAPVPRKIAAAIRLKSSQESIAPQATPPGDDGADALVDEVQFAAPFAESMAFKLELPKGFQDAAGRALSNADSFPLAVATGAMPALAKFAAAPFGIVERFAEGADGPALLPVTLRKVEAALTAQTLAVGANPAEPANPATKVRTLQPQGDAQVIAWYRKIKAYDDFLVNRQQAQRDVKRPLPKFIPSQGGNGGDEDYAKDYVQSRMVSLLGHHSAAQSLQVPRPTTVDPRPFEVVGIPLKTGFHVVEIASPLLGAALLDAKHGAGRTMYVRTSALVTNLAVHFKLGRENSLAWVTSLDKGQPVAGAQVAVSDCRGKPLASATTDAQGRVLFEGLAPEAPTCYDEADNGGSEGYFVSARAPGADGAADMADMAFTWTDWQRGIEPWRFNVPTSSDAQPDTVAHTIFDRTLLRAGETVAMKHLLRVQTQKGFALPATAQEPDSLLITHQGSGQQYRQPLRWRTTATGGRSAHSSFAVPPAAKLGVYQVELQGGSGEGASFGSGEFRVEEFRLPVFEGRVTPADAAALVNVRSVPTNVQLNYVSGGAAAQWPVRVSALVRKKELHFGSYDDFNFSAPKGRKQTTSQGEEEESAADDARVIADKLPLTLDRSGAGRVTLDNVPRASAAQDLLIEAHYADPNGEVQTLRSTHTLWPAAVVAGIKADNWVSASDKVRFQTLALDTSGKALANVPMQVQAIARSTTTSRKRMVGGFYSYDSQTETKDLGTVCTGKSDSRGLLLCEALLDEPGEVELVATARDKDGNTFDAATSVWVTRRGELWFGGQNHDRMDLLPEQKSYQPGDIAKFQVRMPFRFATALVAVEREGVLHTEVVQLNGKDPTVSLKIEEGWGPNVYVSVLALRGRLREVPWYSLFTWGYKAPREWWTAFWYEGKEYIAPTAMVDLSKPAFRIGLAEIKVGAQAHQLNIKVTADKESYPVRGQARITISATLPNGQPAAHAEVALAAVDQALLELMPNTSWKLLDAMLQRRSWGVSTSTAQMEIIGRRHYGRKAVPAGGGGGRSPTRELLDTLLLWQPALALDANGQAQITVPLNDALTSFQIVAVADAGVGMFGTGSTTVRTTQDLQIISGLPPLVREGDQFRAQFTLRNTTKKAMQVVLSPRATLLELPPKTVDLAAGETRELAWDVTAPAQLAHTRFEALIWEIDATAKGANPASDALKISQRIVPAVPLSVQQATLVQVDGAFQLPVQPPAGALPGRGGLQMSLQPTLASGLPGVRDWWARYPYRCLEQQASRAIGLDDSPGWLALMGQLPTYLDSDGLLSYFPPRNGDTQHGSDTLTAYLLASAHEAARLNPAFALADEVRAPMERGLIDFVEGRIERPVWSPRKDMDMRKLAAIEALARYGKAQARMLDSLTIAPQQWPTHTVIDWLSVLQRVKNIPQGAERLAEAQQILRSRLSFQGSQLVFTTEQDDDWWWLMQGGDVNSARLLLAVMDSPAWKADLPRLANGFMARQQNGAWRTTTANLWGGLALARFSATFEALPVAGTTQAVLGSNSAKVDWAQVTRAKVDDASGAAHQTTWFGAPNAPGNWQGNRMFLPWGTGKEAAQPLTVTHRGSGKPWLTLQSLAAVPLLVPVNAGFAIQKTITPIEQANKNLPAGQYTRGDVLRVTLQVSASAPMTWVAITDPIPAGATILGSGLGRDSAIATQGEKSSGAGWPAFEERSFESLRSYYEYLPKGTLKMEYTLRLNNVGEFALPPSQVEALYAPDMSGAAPNARVQVVAAPVQTEAALQK
ncbi:MAG: alpha-2-macroglobulin [Giesbergeria sp.]|nr:alpha-2-macroglobulin [Giesbergeria sp.]